MEGVSRREVCRPWGHIRARAARLSQPRDCLFDTRLKQMSLPDSETVHSDLRIARAEPECLLLRCDALFYEPDKNFAPPNMGEGVYVVAINREHGFVLSNRLVQPPLDAKRLPSGEMGQRIARRCRHG